MGKDVSNLSIISTSMQVMMPQGKYNEILCKDCEGDNFLVKVIKNIAIIPYNNYQIPL